nr:MAG TPA: Movement and RNA silencing protein [Caudoviricetes sp.]
MFFFFMFSPPFTIYIIAYSTEYVKLFFKVFLIF